MAIISKIDLKSGNMEPTGGVPSGLRLKLQATQFLKGTGLLDGYESVIEKLITQGWPSNKNIFDHAAYELLKWHSEHKDEY